MLMVVISYLHFMEVICSSHSVERFPFLLCAMKRRILLFLQKSSIFFSVDAIWEYFIGLHEGVKLCLVEGEHPILF